MSFYSISIHIYSSDFFHRVFREISAYSCIDLKEDLIKGGERRQYTNMHPCTDDLIHPYGSVRRPYKQLGLEIRLVVNCVTEGACLLMTRCNFSHRLCPFDTPLHMYIFYEINETHELFPNLCSFHSLCNKDDKPF